MTRRDLMTAASLRLFWRFVDRFAVTEADQYEADRQRFYTGAPVEPQPSFTGWALA